MRLKFSGDWEAGCLDCYVFDNQIFLGRYVITDETNYPKSRIFHLNKHFLKEDKNLGKFDYIEDAIEAAQMDYNQMEYDEMLKTRMNGGE